MFKSQLETYKKSGLCNNVNVIGHFWELSEQIFCRINYENRDDHVKFLIDNPHIAKLKKTNIHQLTLLDETKTYKDLGVNLSNDLKVRHHIDICVAKANSALGMIKRTFTYIDRDIFLLTYKTFVRPILEYCQEIWSPYLTKDVDKIESVQRRATKLVPQLKEMSYEVPRSL